MASKIKVDQIEGSTGSSITIPSGQTLTIADGLSASTIGSGTFDEARIPNLNASKINAGTLPVARGGTGVTSLGTAGQVIQVNSGASALEFADASGGKIGAVAHTIFTAQFTGAVNSTWTEIPNYNATITPTKAGSTILAMGHISSGSNAGGPAGHGFVLYRSVAGASNSQIDSFTGNADASRRRAMVAGNSESGSDWVQENGAFNVIDSSSTGLSYTLGQSIKYSMYQWNASTTGAVVVNRSQRNENGNDDVVTTSSITLMEILA